MNQDKAKCLDCMDKIKRGLDAFGFRCMMTSNKETILCKVYGDEPYNTGTNTVVSSSYTVATTPTTCPVSMNSTGTCPYTACKYPNATCHLHGSNDNDSSSADNNDNEIAGKLETIGKFSGCLFRIMPNDIYTGLFLHAIKLHGETCDLKMSFEYNENSIVEIINIIKFLVE